MNNLEQHVTSKPLSKKLKREGVKYSSAFVWYSNRTDGKDGFTLRTWNESCVPADIVNTEKCIYSAFLFTELLEILPVRVEGQRIMYGRTDDKYSECYVWLEDSSDIISVNKHPQEAAGKLLIWLIENNHLIIKE